MNTLVVPFAVIYSLGLAGLGLSFLALFQVKAAVRIFERKARANQANLEASLGAAARSVTSLASDVQELQQQPPVVMAPITPRPSLNLVKRSQALRMHRHGQGAREIATALEVPLQEVDLLLKVHRIVLNNLIVTTKREATAEFEQAASA